MPNLYEFLASDEPDIMDRLIGSVINRLVIPAAWRQDLRQQVLLSWLEREYDPGRSRGEILAYAHRCAFLAASEWRRHVVLPVTLSRAGAEPREPAAVSYDDLPVEPAPAIEFLTSDDPAPDGLADEPEWDAFTAHCIDLPPRKSAKVGYAHLVTLLSDGLTVEEVAEVTGLAARSVYRRLASLKHENRSAV